MSEQVGNPENVDNIPALEGQEQPSGSALFADQLAEIKSPDGRQKYKDVETALASIPHAQARINELTAQLAEAQAEANKRKGAEELMDYFNKPQGEAVETPSTQATDEANLEDAINDILLKRDAAKKAQTNREKVKSAFIEQYGEKADSAFVELANNLGLTDDELIGFAEKSPELVLRQLGQAPKPAPNPSSGSFNTAANKPVTQDKPDPMARFRSNGSVMIDKWRASAKSE